MASPAPTIDAELETVTAALAAVEPRTKRLLLFGSRARGDARPDSDFDLLVVMPQATLTPQERQQATRSLRAPAGMWWRGPCGKGGSCMSPAEDALLCHGAWVAAAARPFGSAFSLQAHACGCPSPTA